ncbi:MAG: SPOR domain-containing protein [Lautropia sp.]|nr:SPOR domain-containing protein [Lautropia sp.]
MSDGTADASLTEKKKARHRLVGAIALCLVAAIIVPILLESEPRNAERNLPLAIVTEQQAVAGFGEPTRSGADTALGTGAEAEVPADSPSQTPDRLVMLEERAAAPTASSAPPPAAPQPSQPTRESVFAPPAGRGGAAPDAPAGTPPSTAQERAGANGAPAPSGRVTDPFRPPVPTRQPAPTPAERPDVLARLIDQVDPSKPGAKRPERQVRRFLVQVGAYSNVKSARLASDRVSKAGMTAYHETVKTANGDWIRVRIGPFESREEAEKAQKTLKQAGVTAALIAL